MSEKLPFNEILYQAIESTKLSSAQFAIEVGFFDAGRIYRALKPNGVKLGLDSLETVVNRFPELNADRFIRRSGPVLFEHLCDNKKTEKIEQTITPLLHENETYWKVLAEERLRTIDRQEKEIDFLRKLLDK